MTTEFKANDDFPEVLLTLLSATECGECLADKAAHMSTALIVVDRLLGRVVPFYTTKLDRINKLAFEVVDLALLASTSGGYSASVLEVKETVLLAMSPVVMMQNKLQRGKYLRDFRGEMREAAFFFGSAKRSVKSIIPFTSRPPIHERGEKCGHR